MTETNNRPTSRNDERTQFWKEVVWPTARAVETFFWNLLWFAVIVCLLFSYNPFR